MNNPIYELRSIRQQYRKREVLQVDHLTIFAGEVLALVGPSGAGKSTLLRLLNFLEPPSEGEVIFHGTTFRQGREMPTSLRRRVTTVFQQPYLLNRTVEANVQYGLRLRKNPDSHALVEAALAQVGLAHLAHQRARTLSGGEGQRVALARALVTQPEVLLLDEPTANLDPYNVGMIEKIITETNLAGNTTVVLVTHNVFQAKRLAHRVALMLDGAIVEINDVDAMFESPSDPRTSAFIGGKMVY